MNSHLTSSISNGIADVLERLPLFDNISLRMQAQNIELVDNFIEQLEAELLAEYEKFERTPVESTIFVSALSQLWIFGLYELLRTWRHWVSSLIEHGEKIRETKNISPTATREAAIRSLQEKISDHAATPGGDVDIFYVRSFQRVENEDEFLQELKKAKDVVNPLFKILESIRITLAKHEVPNDRMRRAQAPGYARIDLTNGSLYWIIQLKDGNSDTISRRGLADAVKSLFDFKHSFVSLS